MSNHVVAWARASFQIPTKKKNDDGSTVYNDVVVEQGHEVPDGVPDDTIALLINAGAIVPVDPDAMAARRRRSSADAPSENSSQATWARYAVAHGMDEDEANATSKDELIKRYGTHQ